ncbi:MAG: L-dopachrome tautomerase-related protein [Planctomycetota bacterium]
MILRAILSLLAAVTLAAPSIAAQPVDPDERGDGWDHLKEPRESRFPFPAAPDPRKVRGKPYEAPPVTSLNADLLETVAESDAYQWTGVAVADDGRVFVCFPRWFGKYNIAVQVIHPDGSRKPYPSVDWQVTRPDDDRAERFVCVQSVYVDDKNRLWVLDAGAPEFGSIVRPGGAKLVGFDLDTDEHLATILFDRQTLPDGSYLNDIRVDTEREIAFITESSIGAILTVDLLNETVRRSIVRHPSIGEQHEFVPVIDGRPLLQAHNAKPVAIKSDGIALSPDRQTLYYQALSSTFLYTASADTVGRRDSTPAERVASIGPAIPAPATDGMLMTPDGRLLFTALEHNAIIARTPEGEYKALVRDERLAWPDSMALSNDGHVYVTTSQIHRGHPFALPGEFPRGPYRLFRFDLAQALERAQPVSIRPE